MTETLSLPADLIASIPAFLGFYPADSLVMVALDPGHTGSGRSRIGPVTRADLSDGDAVAGTLGVLADVGVTAAFAFFVGEGRAGEVPHSGTAAALHLGAADRGIRLLGAWWVPRVISGAPYRILTDTSGEDPGSTVHGEGDPWRCGVIPDIATAAAMRELVSSGGMLPELTRREALDFFARSSSDLPEDMVRRITESTGSPGPEVVERLCPGAGESVPGGHPDSCVSRLVGESRRLLESGGNPASDPALLSGAAGLVAHSRIRDLILGCAVDPADAEPLAVLMLAVARTFSGEIRCNALCVYAVALIARGRTARVWPALRSSYDENPDHRLTGLLLSAYGRGRLDLILECCR
ncbi:DUF4192 domain-containing protein [Corynebacterium sp. P5875]|uniref:DUF4192 domain-containing protein n=1 Tax=Corynebacterium antarcticum TaxID=2800405 RepID=A0A9Q4GMX5_9CORY|nr:DUF4192 domain-containing protein [Corynebacterium antarcticum]MCX7537204.1 DUF4192 domain-containing protein [Corynebacterium antarcticum]